MADKNKDKLFVKRYKTLKEHRAAVAARKALKGGKNKGPVANSDAYGETLKPKSKPKPKPAAKPAAKPAEKKPATTAKAKPTKGQTDRFYSSSSQGEYGKKQESTRHRGGARARVNRKPSAPKPKRKPSLADQRREAARRRRRGQ